MNPQENLHQEQNQDIGTVQNSPQTPLPPPQKKSKKHTVIIVALIILVAVLLVASLFFAYTWQDTKSKNEKQAKALVVQLELKTDNLKTTQALLDAASQKLSTATFFPDATKFSPQCDSPNPTDNMYIASVNKETIGGYKLFLISCKSDVAKGTANTKLIGFKVSESGEYEFAYGASSLEPLCIHKGILPNAAELSQKTGLAICVKS